MPEPFIPAIASPLSSNTVQLSLAPVGTSASIYIGAITDFETGNDALLAQPIVGLIQVADEGMSKNTSSKNQ